MVTKTEAMTIHEFEAFRENHPDGRYELVNGEIVEKMPTELHGKIAVIISAYIFMFLQSLDEKLGEVAVEARYRPMGDDYNDLIPDVAFRLTDEAPVSKGAVAGVPDLAVEIKSPDDQIKIMRQKANIYLEHGTAIVWLVYPEAGIIEVYTPDDDIRILKRGDTLSGGDVLPNFTLDVTIVFADVPQK